MTELKDWAEGLLGLIPASADAAPVTITAATIPPLPHALTCGGLVIESGSHDYDTWRIDYPQWSAEKSTYAAIGLAILGTLLHRQSAVSIRLTSPSSPIKALIIQAPSAEDSGTGLQLVATGLVYGVTAVTRHPWVCGDLSPHELPWIKLTNMQDLVITDEQRAQRDCVHGFGSLLGSARFARLLLDFSRPTNQTLEVALESEAGFRGVAPASAELRLWLPGADYWTEPSPHEVAG
jgi:hypothetical protein